MKDSNIFRSEAALSRRGFIGFTATAGTLLALTGCGPSGGASTAGNSNALKKIVIATSADPQPQLVMQANQTNCPWQRLVFNHLTDLDTSGKPQPVLAQSWETSADGLTTTLKIRQGVKFHDGREMTGEDVVFSLNRAKEEAAGCQLRSVANLIQEGSASGNTVTLKLSKPTSQLFDLFQLVPVVDQKTLDGLQGGKQVIGTGPYKWKSFSPGATVQLEKNPDYWVSGAPHFEAVEIAIITQSQALIAAARSNRSQITQGLSPLDLSTISGGDVQTPNSGGIEAFVVGLDASTAPFNNLKVRKAIAKAIDRNRINDQVFKGSAEVSNLWWGKGTPGWDEKTANTYTYKPDEAKKELEALGLAGTEVPFTVNSGDLVARAILDIVRNNFEAAGLKATPNVIETTDFVARNSKGALGPMFLHRTGFGSLSPATTATATAHLRPNGGTHFTSPEYERLISAAQSANQDNVAAANAALGAYMVDQAFNLALVQRAPALAVNKSIKDFKTTNAFQYIILDQTTAG
ncbi:ABC transporter substrate-binding protein [Arthrobacter sp. S39]|uniref:ABC transporter substrate-binding protein n=1 Tax=Arthrobacter sp. S39 TaxID=2509720 RepID=UPI0010371538|nr:ABC transporter substrate-binding protein [Arthrobacter sp. S39]TAP42783.1 ABC transporter substrate-binding protein [Arthrobacter sp. S39]